MLCNNMYSGTEAIENSDNTHSDAEKQMTISI